MNPWRNNNVGFYRWTLGSQRRRSSVSVQPFPESSKLVFALEPFFSLIWLPSWVLKRRGSPSRFLIFHNVFRILVLRCLETLVYQILQIIFFLVSWPEKYNQPLEYEYDYFIRLSSIIIIFFCYSKLDVIHIDLSFRIRQHGYNKTARGERFNPSIYFYLNKIDIFWRHAVLLQRWQIHDWPDCIYLTLPSSTQMHLQNPFQHVDDMVRSLALEDRAGLEYMLL